MRLLAPIRHSLVLLLSVTVLSGSLVAQERTQEQDIFAQITAQSSGGNVTITQPNWLRNLVGKTTFHTARSSVRMGYRIQVYTSNMRGAKQEAYRLASQVRGAAPELSAYVTYSAPFWRLSVGDYGSRQEAQQQLNALRASHPRLMREAYIVREKLRSR